MALTVWDEIFRDNRWGEPTTPSGPGATVAATMTVARILPELVAGIGARRVLDIGCGAMAWMPVFPGVDYIGVDIVAEMIEQNQQRRPELKFLHADARTTPLPRADIAICRHVMSHLSYRSARAMLDNMRRSATWLLATTFDEGRNVDVVDGGFYRIDLRAAPWVMGAPWMVIEDDFRWPDQFLGLWALT